MYQQREQIQFTSELRIEMEKNVNSLVRTSCCNWHFSRELTSSSANRRFSQCKVNKKRRIRHFVLWPASARRWNGKLPEWGNIQQYHHQARRPQTALHRKRTWPSQQTQDLPLELHLRQSKIRTYQNPLLLIGIFWKCQTQVHIMLSPVLIPWQALFGTDSLQYSEHKLSIRSRQWVCVQLHVRCALLFPGRINWTWVTLMLGLVISRPPLATITIFKHLSPTLKRGGRLWLTSMSQQFSAKRLQHRPFWQRFWNKETSLTF